MARYQIDFSTESILDLKEITNFLDEQSSGLGFNFSYEMTLLLERLEGNPFVYQEVTDEIRRGLLGKFNYLVFYKIDGLVVTILGIEHSSRRPRF